MVTFHVKSTQKIDPLYTCISGSVTFVVFIAQVSFCTILEALSMFFQMICKMNSENESEYEKIVTSDL